MIIIGHRGARGLSPENTIASLQKAVDHGVDELEFDLRVTKDKVAILLHDSHLTDPAGTELPLTTHTYAELKQHKADLATFEEVLRIFAGKTRLYAEVKPGVETAPIVAILRKQLRAGRKPEDFLLGSYDQRLLVELHLQLPEIEKIVIERWSGVRAHFRARQVQTKRVSMSHLWLWPGFIRTMARRGYKLCTYSLNDEVKAKRWEKHGLYGVITDYPDRFEK